MAQFSAVCVSSTPFQSLSLSTLCIPAIQPDVVSSWALQAQMKDERCKAQIRGCFRVAFSGVISRNFRRAYPLSRVLTTLQIFPPNITFRTTLAAAVRPAVNSPDEPSAYELDQLDFHNLDPCQPAAASDLGIVFHTIRAQFKRHPLAHHSRAESKGSLPVHGR